MKLKKKGLYRTNKKAKVGEDRHKYADCSADDGMSDHDWDEAFGVAEYNDAE